MKTTNDEEIVVYPNPNGTVNSFVCDHAAPQDGRFAGQVIICEDCETLYHQGAQIKRQYNPRVQIEDFVSMKRNFEIGPTFGQAEVVFEFDCPHCGAPQQRREIYSHIPANFEVVHYTLDCGHACDVAMPWAKPQPRELPPVKLFT